MRHYRFANPGPTASPETLASRCCATAPPRPPQPATSTADPSYIAPGAIWHPLYPSYWRHDFCFSNGQPRRLSLRTGLLPKLVAMATFRCSSVSGCSRRHGRTGAAVGRVLAGEARPWPPLTRPPLTRIHPSDSRCRVASAV